MNKIMGLVLKGLALKSKINTTSETLLNYKMFEVARESSVYHKEYKKKQKELRTLEAQRDKVAAALKKYGITIQ